MCCWMILSNYRTPFTPCTKQTLHCNIIPLSHHIQTCQIFTKCCWLLFVNRYLYSLCENIAMCGQVNPEKSLQSQYFLQLHLNWCQSDFPPWTVILFYNDCWGRDHWMARTSWLECLDHFVNKRKFYWMSVQTVQCWMLVSLVLVGVNVSMMECYVCLTMCYSGDMNINVTIVGMSWHRYDVIQWWPVVCRVSGSSALQWPDQAPASVHHRQLLPSLSSPPLCSPARGSGHHLGPMCEHVTAVCTPVIACANISQLVIISPWQGQCCDFSRICETQPPR